MANNGASFLGEFRGVVGGIVVVDINSGFGQSLLVIFDDFGDGLAFVVTWD